MRDGLAPGLALLPRWPSVGLPMQSTVLVQVPHGLLAALHAMRSLHEILNGAESVTHRSGMRLPAGLLPRTRIRNSALCQARLHPSGPQCSSDGAGDGPGSSADGSAAAVSGDGPQADDPGAGAEEAAGAARVLRDTSPWGST